MNGHPAGDNRSVLNSTTPHCTSQSQKRLGTSRQGGLEPAEGQRHGRDGWLFCISPTSRNTHTVWWNRMRTKPWCVLLCRWRTKDSKIMTLSMTVFLYRAVWCVKPQCHVWCHYTGVDTSSVLSGPIETNRGQRTRGAIIGPPHLKSSQIFLNYIGHILFYLREMQIYLNYWTYIILPTKYR